MKKHWTTEAKEEAEKAKAEAEKYRQVLREIYAMCDGYYTRMDDIQAKIRQAGVYVN